MSQLKAMNLGLNVRREEESSDTVPAGSVTRTDPAAETELQEGQSVTVYVSLGSGKMPELKNQSKENAKSILDAMNLNLRITYLEEESDDIASGNVTRTVPASDSQLSRGQQVTVYVSKGSGKVTVPPVTGLSVRDAIDLLTENGLKYEIKRVYSDTDEKDRVVRQSEAANSKVAKDTIVTREVSDGPEPTEAPTEAPTTAPTEPEPTDEPTQPPEPTEPTVPIAPEELPYLMGGEGTQASPLFYLCAADMQYDQSYFEELLGEKTELWVVFQVREGNALHAELLSELPLKLTRDEETQSIRFTVFIPEQDDVKEEKKTLRAAAADVSASPDVTVVDYDGEYTAAEIAKMRAEKQKEIRDLDLKLRMDKVELERMKQEAANGVVTSKLDGTVLRVNDPDTAKQEGSPVVIVSGGGGYYVKTGVTELDRDKYPVGTQMRIQSWEHGEVYGTVAEISDTPVPSSNNPYYSSGNQNVSFYTMLIALDADSPLREDEWVDVYFNAASTTSEDALCIETRFIRQDDGGSYVYRRGEDQLLHKQYVTTGVVQWGYTEIKSGLTVDDWIAFPYGKDVKENAETIESDNSDDFYYYGSY